MAHKGAPTASDTNAPLEFAIKSAPSDPAGAESSLGNADDASNTAIANACEPCRGWQPIETAPRDGRYLLLWEQYSDNPFVGYWAKDSWSVCHEHVDAEGGWNGAIVVDKLQCPVTHWIALPAAPKQEESA